MRTDLPHIILIGQLAPEGIKKIGGARALFRVIVDDFQGRNCDLSVISTYTWFSGWKRCLNPFVMLWKYFRALRKHSIVMVNVSQGGTRYLMPLLYIFTRVTGHRFVFHPFGGSLHEEYQKYGRGGKWLFRKSVFNAELFVPETKDLYNYYKPRVRKIFWLPNTRPDPLKGKKFDPGSYKKRFVFLGHLKESKGIDLLVEAQKQLGEGYTIDIYGSAEEEKYKEWEVDAPEVYQGVLEKSEVASTLSQYDVLVLPTYFYGEGHPGAVLEAYSLGLPVITTRWRSIPEIVDHKKTGLLISPQSLQELVEAIRFFNEENYTDFSRAARHKYEAEFRTSSVNDRLFETIVNL